MSPKPRPRPVETVAGLSPPLAGFPYFAHAHRFRFTPSATDFSAINAWWLADACFLAYGATRFVEAAFAASPLPGLAWELDWLGTAEDNRGLVLRHDDALVLVFRGTRLEVRSLFDTNRVVLINQDDLWIDSQFLPAVFQAGGHVHAGFLQALREISSHLDRILAACRPGQRLFLAGHSLGGALATLAAAHVDAAPVQGLYTYGCPRVGDRGFATTLSPRCHCRVVHGEDWVPTVPPEFLGYVHGGELHRIRDDRQRAFWKDLRDVAGDFAAAVTAMARELRVDMRDLPLKIAGLVDHAPVYYATLLWNAMLENR
jgi:hypothetical protein